MEQPCLWELIGDVQGLRVLDLGCGEARVSKEFKKAGAKSYLGIEGSKNMFNGAKTNMENGFSEVLHSWLENYTPPENAFDLVVSSLAIHYIEDLELLMHKIQRCLKPGGRFIFSVEHPVITSCNRSLENTALRQAWIVDDYFKRGARNVEWMGNTVTKYHRTIEDFLKTLSATGFVLSDLREAEPTKENFNDEALLLRRSRIPLFLILSASKK
jgi:SAM-dependent methyltransferase